MPCFAQPPPTQPPPNLRPFDDDLLNIQSPEAAQNRLNSTLDLLQSLINNETIENVSSSAVNKIQALANGLNGSNISKTLGKIVQVNYPATGEHPERSTPNLTNPKGPTAETKPPQKRTFEKVAAGKKIVIRVLTAEGPPSLRHRPTRGG